MARKPPKNGASRRGEGGEGHRSPLRQALQDPASRAKIRDADVILGVDVRTGDRSLFYGRSALERGVETGEALSARFMIVPLDFATDELEMLVAACVILKGSCCYDAAAPGRDLVDPSLN
jgi:hypothetical protein